MAHDKPQESVWGVHRVLSPQGSLPQAADRLDASLPALKTELLLRVQQLHLDSASFRQLKDEYHSPEALTKAIEGIITERGKMHNPVTHSGGVLLGTVEHLGEQHPQAEKLINGQTVASLVSLTLTPLHMRQIKSVDTETGSIELDGHAIIFASGQVAPIPKDFSPSVALAAFDVCGAPAQAKRYVERGHKVCVLGLGKAGRAIACQAQRIGATIFGTDISAEAVDWCRRFIPGHFETLNANDTMAIHDWIKAKTGGTLVDMSFQTTNIADTEMATILACRQGGKALFFGMQTSFQKAVLGAEGISRDVELIMGSGYVPGHDKLMLDLLRHHRPLRTWFEENFTEVRSKNQEVL